MAEGVDGGSVAEIRLLGELQVTVGGRQVELGAAKQRVLLAMLAVARKRPVPAESLAEEIWGPHADVDVVSGLQNLVSRLRRALGGGGVTVAARGGGYVLEGLSARLDLERFDAAFARGREFLAQGQAECAVRELRDALGMWRGAALDGFADRPFARAEAARLEEARRAATEVLADALLAAHRPGEAVAALERLVAEAPYREDAWGRLMLALYRCGRQADALAGFQELRRVLAEELGLEPKPGLRQLEARILAQSRDLDDRAGAYAPAEPAAVWTRVFLFTDIEASTRRWEGAAEAMAQDLARHDEILRAAVAGHGGRVISHTGDGICAAFGAASAAVQAALHAQQALLAEPWRGGRLPVRMALHAGAAQERDGTLFGPALNRTARLMDLAAGGQVLCSQAAADLAWDGLPPGVSLADLGEHRLADLARPERVFQLGHPDLPGDFPPLPAGSHPHNLPTGADRFLGRSAELAELETLLRVERMITLWGPGGAGKTRLSIELARRALRDFPDGAWFVELAPVDRAEAVAPAVATALGMLPSGEADVIDELTRYLAPRRALVVLDNCEHVIDAAARVIAAVLARSPAVRVLTSSRELLGLPGELAWPVPSLSLPDSGDPVSPAASDAVALFVERARTAQPAFALTEANAATVGEICRRLDGIPLALELAAARVRVLGVKGLAQRLDSRLGVLTGGPRTADPRHQTLRSAVDWSYDLLPDAERDLLACLSVFSGGFDLAAAEAVAGPGDRAAGFEVLNLLSRLVDKSLVLAEETPDGDIRYRLLETIRQYALEKLDARGGLPTVRSRHLAHYLARAPGIDMAWVWHDAGLHAVDRDYDNFRAALNWAVAQRDGHAALGLASALAPYWIMSEAGATRPWLERALDVGRDVHDVAAAFARMALAYCTHDPELGRQAIVMAQELPDPAALAILTVLVGHNDVCTDPEEAATLLRRGIRLCEEVGLPDWEAAGRNALAWIALSTGNYSGARTHADVGLTRLPPNDASSITLTQLLATRAVAEAIVGDADRAEEYAAAAIRTARRLPLPGTVIIGLSRAATVSVVTGRWNRAQVLLRELLVLLRRVGTRRWVGDALELTTLLMEATGSRMAATRALRDARAHRAALGEPHGGLIPAVREALAACAVRLGEPAYAAAGAAKVSRLLDEVLRDALRALDATD